MMGLFYSEDNLNNTSLNLKWEEMAMMKLIRFYTLVTILATTLMLNLGAPPKAEATFSDTLYYSYYASLYDYNANYYKNLAVSSDATYWSLVSDNAYYAYLYAYYAYFYAPSGTNTSYYAYYSYYYGYFRYIYVYYEPNDYLFDYWRDLAFYYAAYQS
jgi:hypothetical protein